MWRHCFVSSIGLIPSTIVIWTAFGSVSAVENLLSNAKNGEWCVSCLDKRHDVVTDVMHEVDLSHIGPWVSLVLGVSIIVLLIFTMIKNFKRREYGAYTYDGSYEYNEDDEQIVQQE